MRLLDVIRGFLERRIETIHIFVPTIFSFICILVYMAVSLPTAFSYKIMKPLLRGSPFLMEDVKQPLSPDKWNAISGSIESTVNQNIALSIALVVLSGWIISQLSKVRGRHVLEHLFVLVVILVLVSSTYLGVDVKYTLMLSAPKYIENVAIMPEQSLLAVYSKVYAQGVLLLVAFTLLLSMLMWSWHKASRMPDGR